MRIPLGVPELFLILLFFSPPLFLYLGWRRKARAGGYASTRAYLRAVPQTDEERRDAADMALKGVVLCLLGILFKPLVLLGLFALFYGARKVIYSLMGLSFDESARERNPADAPTR